MYKLIYNSHRNKNFFFSVYTYQREVLVGRSSHVLTSLFITRKNMQALSCLLLPLLTRRWDTSKNSPLFEFSCMEAPKTSFETKSQQLVNIRSYRTNFAWESRTSFFQVLNPKQFLDDQRPSVLLLLF